MGEFHRLLKVSVVFTVKVLIPPPLQEKKSFDKHRQTKKGNRIGKTQKRSYTVVVKLTIFCEVGITIEEIAIYFRNSFIIFYYYILQSQWY